LLKASDDATLDRLQGLTEQCSALISDEKERRNPTSVGFVNLDDIRPQWSGADAEKAKRKREAAP
jgi:hypothetical protein